MFEYIFSQIVGEISNQVQSTPGTDQKESVLNAWRLRLKGRMRELEKELKSNTHKYLSDDFDQTEDNQKESHDKFSFCHFLIEDFIDEKVAETTGKSLASVVSSSTHQTEQRNASSPSGRPEGQTPPPLRPFQWTGSRREVVSLVQYLSQVANGSSSDAPAPEDIVAVSSMFVDSKGKQFPEELFLPKLKPAPRSVTPPKAKKNSAKVPKSRKRPASGSKPAKAKTVAKKKPSSKSSKSINSTKKSVPVPKAKRATVKLSQSKNRKKKK